MNHTIRFKSFLVLFILPCFVFGQIVIKGKVTEKNNSPLPGVTIMVKGTSNGTITNLNGDFSINVPTKECIIKASFMGFITQEINADGTKPLNIQLETDNVQLNDVVIIGYGTVQKKDLTGAIQSISGSDLEKTLNSNITESLNGHVAGVVVSKSSNRPGADMSVEIRGQNSINSSNEPLYVIDGVPSYSGMKFLNSSDIESIDILKDASSCAIYGSRGANGVVIITTKGATKTNGFTIEYSGSEGVKTPTRIPDMIGNQGNGMEYVNYRIALWTKKYGLASLSRSDFLTDAEKKRIKYGQYYDWLRELSGNGLVSTHNINSSGSTENTSYTFGIGFLNDKGMVGKEDFQRITANIGLEHRLSKKIKTGVNAYFSKNNTDLGSNNALLNAYFIPPIESPWDENGDLLFICQPTSSKINPLIQVQNDIHQKEAYYATLNSFVEYTPIPSLNLKSSIAYQFDNDVNGEYVGQFTQENSGVNPAYAIRSEDLNTNWVWDNTITYKKKFNPDNRIEAIGLFSMQNDQHEGSSIMGTGLPYESDWHAIQTAQQISNVSSYFWESSMISYMIRANYTLQEKYMLTLTGRYDGTSRLQHDKQWGFMPSLALGWQLKNENFLKDFDPISKLKVRLSYGKTGNNNLNYDITVTKLALSKYSFSSTGVNGFGLSGSKGNGDLNWEMTSEYNLGLDFGFLNNRISGTIDLYSRMTSGLIFNRSISAINGYNSIYQNIGTTSNKGIELSLNTFNISTKDFNWKSTLTFSLNRNKIIDLYGDKKDDLGNRWFIGQPVNVVYDYKQIGIWQTNEADEAAKYGQTVGQIHIEDKNKDGKIDANDLQIVGVRSPDWTAGFNNTFIYKDFDLGIDIYARIGGVYTDDFTYMFTSWDNEHWNKLNVKYWTPENNANHYPEVGSQSYYTQVISQISGTFVKVRNITLGYNLNEKKLLTNLGLKSARLSATVQNPFTFTGYVGSDPEVIGENVYSQLSLYPMTFTFGLKLIF